MAVNREARETRNALIVAAVLAGETRIKVVHSYGVSPRTLRRVMQRWHAGELSFDVVTAASVQAALLEMRADVQLVDEMIDRAAGDLSRSVLIQDRTDLVLKQARFVSLIWGPEALMRRHELDPESTHEINARVRGALLEHGVGEEAIEAAVDSVITWLAERTGLWGLLGASP